MRALLMFTPSRRRQVSVCGPSDWTLWDLSVYTLSAWTLLPGPASKRLARQSPVQSDRVQSQSVGWPSYYYIYTIQAIRWRQIWTELVGCCFLQAFRSFLSIRSAQGPQKQPESIKRTHTHGYIIYVYCYLNVALQNDMIIKSFSLFRLRTGTTYIYIYTYS